MACSRRRRTAGVWACGRHGIAGGAIISGQWAVRCGVVAAGKGWMELVWICELRRGHWSLWTCGPYLIFLLCSVLTSTDNMPFDYFLPTHIMLFMLRRQIICCWFGQRHSHACGASIDAVNVICVGLTPTEHLKRYAYAKCLV
jgi:hypothetical protein